MQVTSWDESLGRMFEKQRTLMRKFKEIEKLPDPPLSLHHTHGQKILKDFSQRVVEKMSQSYTSLRTYGEDPDNNLEHLDHHLEELADALHYLLEMVIFSGISVEQLRGEFPSKRHTSIFESYWGAVFELSNATALLKNRPWKPYSPTDEGRFRHQLVKAFAAHLQVWADLELSPEVLEVNFWRKL